MTLTSAPQIAFPEPISPNWTIECLLNWFAEDDDRLSDVSLRPLLVDLAESLSGSEPTAAPRATSVSAPAIISLVRAIALHSGAHPAVRAQTLAATGPARESARSDLVDRDASAVGLHEVGAAFTDEHHGDVRVDRHDLRHH